MTENENKQLDKIEYENEKEFKIFLSGLLIYLSSVNSINDFAIAQKRISDSIDLYLIGYKDRLKQLVQNAGELYAPNYPAKNLVNKMLEQKFLIEGTKNYVTIEELIARHGEKLKSDIFTTFLSKNGYETPSNATLKKIEELILSKNKKSLSGFISNEVHKTVELAKIEEAIATGKEGKVFRYNTQQDDRVRPSHAKHQGEELTISEAEDLRNTVMSEQRCRCYLTNI